MISNTKDVRGSFWNTFASVLALGLLALPSVSTVAAAADLATNLDADDGSCSFASPDAAIQAARKAEASCIANPFSSDDERVECLDAVVDTWWHCVGDYSEIIRIEKIQLGYHPSALATRLDIMGNIAWLGYSVDVDNALTAQQAGQVGDFSTGIMSVFDQYEAENAQNYDFYDTALDTPALIVINKQIGTDATKRQYYAYLKRVHAKCEAMLPAMIAAGGTPEEVLNSYQLRLRSTGKTLDRYQQYDAPVTTR